MLTATLWLTADCMTYWPLASKPDGRTGRVSVMDNDFPADLAAASSAAMACERRSIEAWSATAAPSMSKSIWVRSYSLITDW